MILVEKQKFKCDEFSVTTNKKDKIIILKIERIFCRFGG